MTATYCVAGRWYYIEDATLVADHVGRLKDPRLWTGWIYVREKKYHTDRTVTLFGETTLGASEIGMAGKVHPDETRRVTLRVVLEMRRGLTVRTLKDGPPVFVINEQTLT